MADIKTLLKGVQENIPLAPYTTFKIGGPAKYFFIAKSAEDVKNAVKAAREASTPFYIIGNGSNVLVSDKGFDGLVIKVQSSKLQFKVQSCSSKFKIIKCDSGVLLGKLISESIKSSLTGLEWMAGIPGTFGGAIYGNAGAFGHSIGESAESVEVLDPDDLSVRSLSGADCKFGYRDSDFKKQKYVILSATLKLKKGDKDKSDKTIKEYLKKRKGRHPIGSSAGSIFKNPPIQGNEKAFEKILAKFPEAEKFKAAGKIPAGWLIEEYGLLGKKIGGAMVAKEHGNFILNAGGAKAEDVIMLISLIKQKIRVNFDIQLEEEIQYVGF